MCFVKTYCEIIGATARRWRISSSGLVVGTEEERLSKMFGELVSDKGHTEGEESEWIAYSATHRSSASTS